MNTSPSSSAKQAQEALGARLREIRKDAGLSGRALAAATGQHFTRVSKLEHGVQTPSGQDIRDWCQACGAETILLPVIGLNVSRPWEVGRVLFHPAGAAAGLIEAARAGSQDPAVLEPEYVSRLREASARLSIWRL